MLNFLKRKLLSQRGAMDRVLVTLLLVMVGIAAVVGLATWMNSSKTSLVTDANSSVQSIKADN